MPSARNLELIELLCHPGIYPRVKPALPELARELFQGNDFEREFLTAAAKVPGLEFPGYPESVILMDRILPDKFSRDRDHSRNLREHLQNVGRYRKEASPELIEAINDRIAEMRETKAAGMVAQGQRPEAQLAWEKSQIPFIPEEPEELPYFDQRFIDTADPPPANLVDSLIANTGLTILTGEAAAGKGRLMTQLAYSLATGQPDWLPGGPEINELDGPESAVFITTEDDPDWMGSDIRRAQDELELPPLPDGKFSFIHYREYSLAYADEASPFWMKDGGLSAPAHDLMERAASSGVRLLILDHKGSLYGGQENDRNAVSVFLTFLNSWARKRKVALILLAHPPKGIESAAHGYSGSTEWINVPRVMAEMKTEGTDGTKYRILRTRKNSRGSYKRFFLATNGPWWKVVPTTDEARADFAANYAVELTEEEKARIEEEAARKMEEARFRGQTVAEYATYRREGMSQEKAHAKVVANHPGDEILSRRRIHEAAKKEGLLS